MTETTSRKRIQYLCAGCNQKRVLQIESTVHMNRHELNENGLAPYIDIHLDKDGNNRHGMILRVDADFNVRTNERMKLIENKKDNKQKSLLIPAPKITEKEFKVEGRFRAWNSFEMKLKTYNRIIQIQNRRKSSEPSLQKGYNANSNLNTVSCNWISTATTELEDSLKNFTNWVEKLCDAIELASSPHLEGLPYIINFIGTICYKEIEDVDFEFLKLIVDKSSIVYPISTQLEKIRLFHRHIQFYHIESAEIPILLDIFSKQDQYSMIQLFKELESVYTSKNMKIKSIYNCIYNIYKLDGFDFITSYLISM